MSKKTIASESLCFEAILYYYNGMARLHEVIFVLFGRRDFDVYAWVLEELTSNR